MIEGANFIDGAWVPAVSGRTFERRNPADPDDVVGTFPASGPDDVRSGRRRARQGRARVGRHVPPERRAAILEAAAAQLESRSDGD